MQIGYMPPGTLTGRAQIEKYYSGLFAADMTRTVKDELRKVRFITSDTAMLDVDNVVTSRKCTNRNHGIWITSAERPVGVRCATRHSEAVVDASERMDCCSGYCRITR